MSLLRAPAPGNFNVNCDTYVLNIPNYTFGKAIELAGAGSLIAISMGKRISDNMIVLAKISPHSVRLEREYYVTKRLSLLPDGKKYIAHAIDYISLVQDGLAAIIYADINPMDYFYLEKQETKFQSLFTLSDVWSDTLPCPPADCTMRLGEFLSFSIECCSALQFLHENGVTHGELRPSAFQYLLREDQPYAKVWNFGSGLRSYEDLLLTSSRWRSYMMSSTDLSQNTTRKASRYYSSKEFHNSLPYISPEQTGRTSNILDHRADLYSLGIMFFIILTNRAPFEGTALDIIHSILSKNVPLVHTLRKDVPPVISLIIDKLTRKAVDERYESAYGLREDLLECKMRIASQDSYETLIFFPLGLHDINPVFYIPDGIYGRTKELEKMQEVLHKVYNSHKSEKKKHKQPVDVEEQPIKEADKLLRVGTSTSLDHTQCEIIVLKGPGGIGKSTIASNIHTQSRHFGYTATAKFDKNQKRPYNGLLKCLSSILRQLLTESETTIREFYADLKINLGPQFSNVRLMVNKVPELKPILADGRNSHENDHNVNIENSETRFHLVFLNILRTIARKKMITLCLDDLQEADDPSVQLINALLVSHTTMLIILTFRDGEETPIKVVEMLNRYAKPVTNITLRPLGKEALGELVLCTLDNSRDIGHPDEILKQKEMRLIYFQPLIDILYKWTEGNPFYAKQFLKMMKRKNDIWFDWNDKKWKYRLDNIDHSLFKTPMRKLKLLENKHDRFDVRNLFSHLKSLDVSAQIFCMWASLLGHSFNFKRVKWLMISVTLDRIAEENPLESNITEEEESRRSNLAMSGLQLLLNEGVIHNSVGNEFCFIHDRYYQAASTLIDNNRLRQYMHLTIAQMLIWGSPEEDEQFYIADHLVKSIKLLKKLKKTQEYRSILIGAGNEASISGALQIANTYYESALSLLPTTEDKWLDGPDTSFDETLNLHMRLLEINWLEKEENSRNELIDEILAHTESRPLERAQAWRIKARAYFQKTEYRKGIDVILKGLGEVMIEPVMEEAPLIELYGSIRTYIQNKGGLDVILSQATPCKDVNQLSAMSLLNEACTGAYWIHPFMVEFFSLKLCELSLNHGYSPSSGGGFVWAGCTATRLSEFDLASRLGQFGIAISEKFAGNADITRSIITYHSMLAQWTGVHVKDYIYQYQRAYKFAIAAGDKLYSSLALFYVALTLYWTSCNLSEIHWHLNHAMEECKKGKSKDVWILNTCLWRSVLVFQGKTDTIDPEKIMNDPNNLFDEESFFEDIKNQTVNSVNPLNWHYSFKMILLFHFGFRKEAAELGFKIFDNSVNEAVHRHVGIAMYYHCMSIVDCLRDTNLDASTRLKYTTQLYDLEKRLGQLADHSEVNYRMYHRIVQAQISTLDPTKIKETLVIYEEVMGLALEGKWDSFLGMTYELVAEYYILQNLSMLAVPAIRQSLKHYKKWAAYGKIKYLTNKYKHLLEGESSSNEKKDVSVQTEDVIIGSTTNIIEKGKSIWDNNSSDDTTAESSLRELYGSEALQTQRRQQKEQSNDNESHTDNNEDPLFSLDMIDLTSIIKSSQVISNEMNSFDELLKKMMDIIMTNSGAESGSIIIKETTFGIAAYMTRTLEVCETYEPPLPLVEDDKSIEEKTITSIVHYVIHTLDSLFIPNLENDTRFATSDLKKKISVICRPIVHKSTLVGVLYLQANVNAFTYKHANVLALLCDQIGISITNALLFKSVQKATKANSRMIQNQLKALEEARASKEQALKATKMKSNFLANMSHELRTPFSGFYGMISLLSETNLDVEQRELVTISKQSCEMLLHIIDDLLDFSKLEAHKVKLQNGLFYIEDLIADRIELLITLASDKNIELFYFIDSDVPPVLYGDSNRIGQVLMNLVGNAIKFTHQGEVIVRCSLGDSRNEMADSSEMMLKISVEDTGIGMAPEETNYLFLPFSQVDGSTTRNFGGTGLGLSICLQLVRLMCGDIQVESKLNEGSKFTFNIKVKKGQMISAESDFESRETKIENLYRLVGQPHILVICQEQTRKMVEYLITSLFHLEYSTSIEEASRLITEKSEKNSGYDCIIVDSPSNDEMQLLLKTMEGISSAVRDQRIILCISPTMGNMRQQYITRFSMMRLSKPIRRLKLLNILVKILADVTPVRKLRSKQIRSPSAQDYFSIDELSNFQGKKILVAEDNEIARRLIKKQLTKLGFVVETCNNGFECFQLWKTRGPGYYLLAWIDHHMPGCDGLEATRKIRAYEGEMGYTIHLPIIALTADIQISAQKNCLDAGMNDYVTKPLMQHDLANILRRYGLTSV
ncbi:hypothetical protein BDB01DRAFT_851685 [Pilobolus umbonatus]|nr:hypothetical protein BDB01DRAFT_851685 [Pilobolus umbonatus]